MRILPEETGAVVIDMQEKLMISEELRSLLSSDET